ncbi:unnamed protein product [Pipistrellus nathusii]|uniref:Uncharacterized protein n=1 Tax=Pipistrellus nathusii TaxID=59473 RepID=A0ABN9ZUH1_PIPNA
MEQNFPRCVREAWDSVEKSQEPSPIFKNPGPWSLSLYPALGYLTWDDQDNLEQYSAPCGFLKQFCPVHRPRAQSTSSQGATLPTPDPRPQTQEPEKPVSLWIFEDPGRWTLPHYMLVHLFWDNQNVDQEPHSGPWGFPHQDYWLHGPRVWHPFSPGIQLPVIYPTPITQDLGVIDASRSGAYHPGAQMMFGLQPFYAFLLAAGRTPETETTDRPFQHLSPRGPLSPGG